MSETHKKGLRWKIFNWFGPPEVQNLVTYIDELVMSPEGTGDIVIYPLGEFSFNVKTSNEDELDPMVFPTAQERTSFQVGLSYGVGLMGGSTTALNEADFQALNEMQKESNSGGGSGSIN